MCVYIYITSDNKHMVSTDNFISAFRMRHFPMTAPLPVAPSVSSRKIKLTVNLPETLSGSLPNQGPPTGRLPRDTDPMFRNLASSVRGDGGAFHQIKHGLVFGFRSHLTVPDNADIVTGPLRAHQRGD